MGQQQQQGIVLVIALVFLVVMTLIGVTSIQSNIVDERMVANQFETDQVFQAAESALRTGETFILSSNIPSSSFNATCTDGLCLFDSANANPPWQNDTTWNDANLHTSCCFSADPNGVLTDSPKFIVELLPPPLGGCGSISCEGYQLYRITARAVGRTNSNPVLLQSIVRK